MCFNALTFVIQAWRGYEGMFENLSELLEKCVEFLERLESYRAKMDARLSRLACQNLQLFVEICDRMIKLRKKHNRFLAFTKNLFLNDDGVRELLGMMDRLNSKESLLVNAQTYKIVSDSADGIKLILDGQQEQKKVEDSRNWRKKVVQALGFPPGSLDSDAEPIISWRKTLDHRKNRLVEGTGNWLSEHDAFVSWTQSPSAEQNIFIIEGKNGSGKTSLMANGLRLVRHSHASSASTTARVVFACYSSEKDTKKVMENADGVIFESATKALLWQLCTSYEAMTKSTAQIVDRHHAFDGNMDLWRNLFLDNKELHNQDTTFFIFLDGVDSDIQSFVPLLEKLSSQRELRRKVRICLTTQAQASTDRLISLYGIPFHKLYISDHNLVDVKHCICFQLDSMPVFKDSSRTDIRQWRDRILDTLLDKCEGDYFRINSILKRLSLVDLISDIEAILADAGKTRIDQIDAEIQRLNDERTPAEIAEINTILRWVIHGVAFVQVDTMQSLLSLRSRMNKAMSIVAQIEDRQASVQNNKETSPSMQSSSTLSLLPFRQKLQEKYPIFAITDSGCVDWRTPEIEERIPKDDSGDVLDDGVAGQFDVVRDSEVQIVQHFLHTVCPSDLYRRFGFERFFAAKLGVGSKKKIHDDADNAHILCALDCLHILVSAEFSSDKELYKMAILSLLFHLKNVDMSRADRRLKEQVGPMLVMALTDGETIDRLFLSFRRPQLWSSSEAVLESLHEENRVDWIYARSGTEAIARWLRDSAVTKYIVDEPGKTIVLGAKDESASEAAVILGHIAKRMAHHLFHGRMGALQDFHPERYAAMAILRAYLARVDPSEQNEAGAKLLQHTYNDFWNSDARKYFEERHFSTEFLASVETWAAGILRIADETPAQASAWEMNAALNYEQLTMISWFAQPKSNSARAKNALKLDASNWDALLYLSTDPDYHQIPQYEALNLLRRAKSQIDVACDGNSTWLQDPSRCKVLANIMFELGRALWLLELDHHNFDMDIPLDEHFAEAAELHRQSLQFGEPNLRSIAYAADVYRRARCWSLWIQFIHTFTSYKNRWASSISEVNKEILECYYSSRDWPERNKFANAADAAQGWEVIENFFAACIEAALQYCQRELWLRVRVHYGLTLYLSSDGKRKSQGICKLLELLKTESEDGHASHVDLGRELIDVKMILGIHYLGKALEPDQTEAQRIWFGEKIADLIDKDDSSLYYTYQNPDVTLACCLIRYEVRFGNGTLSDLAKSCLQRIVMSALEVLSDDIDDNDVYGYEVLQSIFGVLGDMDNLHTAWMMWAALIWDDKLNTERTYLSTQQEPSSVDSSNLAPSEEVPSAANLGPGSAGDDDDKASVTSELRYVQAGYTCWQDCRHCGSALTTISKPMRFCLDCPERFCVEEECFESFKAGEKLPHMITMGRVVSCSAHHTFYVAPACPYSVRKAIPEGHVIVSGSTKEKLQCVPLEEWKATLRTKYMQT
ncbi:hypothetical protein BGZ63DRAFT_397450 [Mariannaea sp. PMI_226]|nr:hypothetical protein BGZ63DRAFT_397450 [Mariannaea sp. PMI_226]